MLYATEMVPEPREAKNEGLAMIFGFLGVLKDRNETNCLKDVTGADRDSCSGVIHLPK